MANWFMVGFQSNAWRTDLFNTLRSGSPLLRHSAAPVVASSRTSFASGGTGSTTSTKLPPARQFCGNSARHCLPSWRADAHRWKTTETVWKREDDFASAMICDSMLWERSESNVRPRNWQALSGISAARWVFTQPRP